MAVNTLGFTQVAEILQEMVYQVTGVKISAPVNYNEFVTVGTTLLKCGTEQLMGAISSVIGRTVFSVRPYDAKFRGLERSEQQYGDMTRKLTMIDGEVQENPAYELEDGQSVDQWIVKKDKVLQTNFYGFSTYEKQTTFYRKQLNVAFRGPEELASYIGMKTQNVSDQIEQARETFNRGALCNLAMGAISSDATVSKGRVVRLVNEYNAFSGKSLNNGAGADGVFGDDNIEGFATWFYARFAEIIGLMEERSSLFHTSITGVGNLNRHTRRGDMHAYFATKFMTLLDTKVHSRIFHNEYLKFMDYEPVNFWQSIMPDAEVGMWDRYRINGRYTYLQTDGSLYTAATGTSEPTATPAPTQSAIIGILFDRDAAGTTINDVRSHRTPLNARGEYSNVFYKWTGRYWNDFTENVVVFLI